MFSIVHPHQAAQYSERQKRMYNFLHQQHVGVLCTVGPDKNPHGAVVYYAVDQQFMVRILTKTGTRKYDNMVHNDHVMLTVFDPDSQTTAQITGVAMERSEAGVVSEVARMILTETRHAKGNGLPPIAKLQAGRYTTFAIKPVQVRMAVYARPHAGDYRTMFESIESFDLDEDAS